MKQNKKAQFSTITKIILISITAVVALGIIYIIGKKLLGGILGL